MHPKNLLCFLNNDSMKVYTTKICLCTMRNLSFRGARLSEHTALHREQQQNYYGIIYCHIFLNINIHYYIISSSMTQ